MKHRAVLILLLMLLPGLPGTRPRALAAQEVPAIQPPPPSAADSIDSSDSIAGPVIGRSGAAGPYTYLPWLPPLPWDGLWRTIARADSARVAAAAAARGAPTLLDTWIAAAELPPSWGEHADLDLSVRGRASLGGAWNRVHPCSATSSLRCERGFMPRIRPDLQLVALASGTVLQRVQVEVDYDQGRDFSAANNLRIAYQGAAGDRLQRVEAGNVSFTLPATRASAGIPAGSFGVRATGSLGPVQLQALWARSRTEPEEREFRLAGNGGGAVHPVQTSVEDADYARGQFFFLFDPARLASHPHVDVRALRASDGPAELVPARGIQLYRYSGAPAAQDGSTLLLRAAPHDPARTGEAVTGAFRLLRPGTDYHLHPSGLWFVLARPVGDDEALGVAYATASGSVGDAAGGGAPVREIRLLKGLRATHQPGSSTWPLEMHHVYRLPAADDVDASSLRLTISLGDAAAADLQRRHPATGAPVPFLQLFGLDADSPPGQVDERHLYRPAAEGADAAIPGAFLVFPTLRPFAAPPPAPGLSAAEAAAVLGRDSVPGIYGAPDARARREARRFRLNLAYAARGRGIQSVLSLGTAGIRPGSERVQLAGRTLERGVDYEIRYETGELELRNPVLLGAGGDLRVAFEQDPLFQTAPVMVMGISASHPLGRAGAVSVFGVSQRERALLRRPALGSEPSSLLVGGVSGRVAVAAPWLGRALGWLGPQRDTTPAELVVSGELVMAGEGAGGQAYLDDFEQGDEIVVPLNRQAWRLGSAPRSASGAETVAPPVLDASSAGTLAWQHDYRGADGRIHGGVRTAEVDTLIRSTGRGLASGALHLSLGGDGAGPRWRAITSVLSPTGADLRDYEYLEFYLRGADAEGAALVLDLGTVSEDALATDDAGADGGVDAAGRPWGRGVLDQEWDPSAEAWVPAVHDAAGLWAGSCAAHPGETYVLGEPRSNCTRGNGLPDTEDLNGNGVLDAEERVLRYVVPLDDAASPYLARGREQTGTEYRLYRIPLREGLAVGASPGAIQHVQHLRMLLAGGGALQGAITRMRFVGARWRKRTGSGVVHGLAGSDTTGIAGGELAIGPVSRVTLGPGYVSPPGIVDQRQNPADDFGAFGGAEFNEKSLALTYRGVGAGDRAEAVLSFEGRPRNLLAYGTLRLWAVAADGGGAGEHLVLRVGSGAENFYLYRRPLARAGRPRVPGDWGPEVVVELSRWTELRAAAEAELQRRPRGEGGPVAVWDADSTYGVVVTDRGRAPNLATVQEVSLGIWNGGTGPVNGELWVNDVRLADAARAPGASGQLGVTLRKPGVFEVGLAWASRSGHFRDFRAAPSYEGESALTLTSTWQAGRLLPAHWRIDAPVTVQHQAAATTPILLSRTDLQASRLAGLRTPRAGSTRIAVRLDRRAAPGTPASPLLDGLGAHFSYEASGATALYSDQRSASVNAGVRYLLQPASRTLPLLPDSGGRGLPGLLGRVPGVRGLAGARLRWSPTTLSFSTEYARGSDERSRFESFLSAGAGAALVEETARRQVVQRAAIGFRPLPSLAADATARWARDLLPAAEQNQAAAGVVERERVRLGPLDLGRESGRSLSTSLSWSPRPWSWLSGQAGMENRFEQDANPAYLRTEQTDGDTVHTLLRSLDARRDLRTRITLSPAALLASLGARPAGRGTGAALAGVLRRATGPVEVTWTHSLNARFHRADATAGWGMQLGTAGRDGLFRIGADTASALGDQTRLRAGTQLHPFGGLRMTLAYQGTRTDAAGGRTQRTSNERVWPEVDVQWSGVPAARWTGGAVSSLVLGSGITRQTTDSDDPASDARHAASQARVPLTLGLALRGGLSFSYRGEWRTAGQQTHYSRTQAMERAQGVTVAGPVRLPHTGLFAPRRLDVSLSWTQADRRECRPAAEGAGCSAETEFARARERALRFQVDTRVQQYRIGLHGDYASRASLIGQKEGSSQFQVGLFAEFDLSSARRTP